MNKSILVFTLLAFSLLLFGCVNQQGYSNTATTGNASQASQVSANAPIPSDVDTSTNEATSTAQDLNDLDFNESELNVT